MKKKTTTVQCCMPASSSDLVAPFCIPVGSTCCGDTFCVAGEVCCGGFCCPAVCLFFLPSLYPPHSSLLQSHLPSFLTKREKKNRTQPATSTSRPQAAARSAPSAPAPPPAPTTPRHPPAHHPHPHCNVVPPTYPSAAISNREG